jgi:hypothetical protein
MIDGRFTVPGTIYVECLKGFMFILERVGLKYEPLLLGY